jgi:CO dehydrogenase/acetyl-CoA synthase beta subunit
MGIFDREIAEVRDLLEEIASKRGFKEWRVGEIKPWPGGKGNLHIPASDTAVEFGPPELPSILMTLITDNPDSVRDGLISLIGNDIDTLAGRKAPLAKIIFIEASGIAEEDLWDFYLDVNLARLDVSLWGYMTRASSGMRREWCRISRDALKKGMSIAHIGAGEIACVRKLPSSMAVEMAFLTGLREDVTAFAEVAFRVERVASALCKLSKEILHDCDKCRFSDLCSTLPGLSRLRESKKKGAG